LELASLVPFLQDPEEQARQRREVNRALTSDDPVICAIALAALSLHMAAGEWTDLAHQCLRSTLAPRFARDRVFVLSKLSPALPESLLPLALQVAREIDDRGARITALATLAPHLPKADRERIESEEVLRDGLAIWDDQERIEALTALVPHLSEGLRHQAVLALVKDFDKGIAGSQSLVALARYIPEDLWIDAFGVAMETFESTEHLLAEAVLAPYCGEPEREKLIHAIFKEACNYPYLKNRWQVLVALVPHLAEGEMRQDAVRRALEAARAELYPQDRALALVAVLPLLPVEMREGAAQQALQAAFNGNYPASRADALGQVVPHLPEEERADILCRALEGALATEYADDRAKALARLGARITDFPADQRAEVLRQLLHALATQSRNFLLRQLQEFCSPLGQVGGQDIFVEIYRSIQDVTKWWP
jgi:hypothetical protein